MAVLAYRSSHYLHGAGHHPTVSVAYRTFNVQPEVDGNYELLVNDDSSTLKTTTDCYGGAQNCRCCDVIDPILNRDTVLKRYAYIRIRSILWILVVFVAHKSSQMNVVFVKVSAHCRVKQRDLVCDCCM